MNHFLVPSFSQMLLEDNRILLAKNNWLYSRRLLKQGVWLYFLLLIFEGGLRKWLIPGLATPLLLIRDPIAIWLVLTTWRKDLLPTNATLIGIVLIGIAGTFTAIFLGHRNLGVALYGARLLLIHFPLVFVIGRLFSRQDVLKMGKVALMMTIPMTILIIMQFYSPQSSWVNRGVGGDIAGAGFSGSGNFFRPPGTFSFTNGTTLFYSMVTPFVFYFLFHQKEISRFLFIAASLSLLVAIPFTISRSLFFQFGLTGIFCLFSLLNYPKFLFTFLFMVIGIIVMVLILNNIDLFHTAIEAFFNRFESANEIEGGIHGVLVDRFLGGMVGALTESQNQPFFGYGLGIGTNAGSAILTGNRAFLVAEEEWGRIIGELGPLMGLCVIFLRIKLTLSIVIASIKKLLKGDSLPWILLSFGLITMAQGGWAQPTSLGFCVMIGGLMLASLRQP